MASTMERAQVCTAIRGHARARIPRGHKSPGVATNHTRGRVGPPIRILLTVNVRALSRSLCGKPW